MKSKSLHLRVPQRQQSALLGDLIKLPNIFEHKILKTESSTTPIQKKGGNLRLLRKSVEDNIYNYVIPKLKKRESYFKPQLFYPKQKKSIQYSPWKSD